MSENAQHPQSKIRLMLVSLLISLLTWVSLSGRTDESSLIRVFPQIPLLHQNIPPEMKLKTDNYQISVALNGKEKDLNGINPNSDIQVMLNLQGYGEGEWTMPLTTEDVVINGPKGLTVSSIIPDTVRLRLEKVGTKEIPLSVNTFGEPAENFFVKEVILKPNAVTITGPAAQLEKLDYLEAEAVSVAGASESISGKIVIDSKDIPTDAAILQIGNLEYRILIEEKQTTKRFSNPIPVQQADPVNENITLTPLEVDLEITGPVSAVEWFDPTWIIPELLVSEFIIDEPIALDGEQTENPEVPAQPKLKTIVPISDRWQIPEEIKQNDANWATKISKLQLKWIPGQVEVEQK